MLQIPRRGRIYASPTEGRVNPCLPAGRLSETRRSQGSPRVDIAMRMTYFKSTVLGGTLSEKWNEGKKGHSDEG
jgi:hypothetical protein